MAIVVLLRHGRTQSNASGVLAGWTPGIGLDETGRTQAARVAARLSKTPLAGALLSPLQRCQETAKIVLAEGEDRPAPITEDDIGECRYGDWTGRPLKELAKEPLWKDVQARPSSVMFPSGADFPGEGMQTMQDRAVAAVRRFDAEIEDAHGPGAIWLAVSHGDVIKAILADAAGTALDNFQRIVADPASVSVVRYTKEQPFLLRTNDTTSEPIDLGGVSKAAQEANNTDAAVGGGAGND